MTDNPLKRPRADERKAAYNATVAKLTEEKEEALASLRKSEDHYRTVFENTGTATFVKESDMTISMVNTGFENLTGYTKGRIEGRMIWTDFFLEEDRDRLIRHHADRRAGKPAPTELECRLKDRQGQIKDVVLRLDLIPGTRKSIGSFMDITRLKRMERDTRDSRGRLEGILNAYEGSIYVSSQDFKLQYVNEFLAQKIGFDAVGHRCYQAIHNRSSVCPFCVMKKVAAGETVRFEVKDPNDQRWYYSMNAPMRHGDGSVSLLAMITDIHDRKCAEIAMRKREDSLRKENIVLRSEMKGRYQFNGIVGQSIPMQRVYEQIINAAASDANVIIYGEPGTGKELVAHAIHNLSRRRDRRIVPVHCGAIPENLIESEFFGYKKGAFSGADADKPGYLAYADGGTLFLDEVGEVSLHMQVKLLRVIEGGGYTPVGSSQVRQTDVRIIAATNRDLRDRMEKGHVREDFFYRIHILPIRLPSLRERKEDLPLLMDHFLRLFSGKKNISPITGRLYDFLYNYDWPGNVRELQNVVIRYCSLGNMEVTESALLKPQPKIKRSAAVFEGEAGADLKTMVGNYEKHILMETLAKHRWHRSKTAEVLGIDRKTLFNKMRQFGLNKAE